MLPRAIVRGVSLRGRRMFSLAVERVDHVTLMKTRRPLEADELAEVQRRLASVPGVVGVRIGPAKDSDVFNAALVVSLLDANAASTYLTDPEKLDVESSILLPLLMEGKNEGATLNLSYSYTHHAVLRPGPAMMLGGAVGALLGGGLTAIL